MKHGTQTRQTLQSAISLLILMSIWSTSASALELSGEVEDAVTRTPISGAHISVNGHHAQTITDDQGRFALDLPQGVYVLRIEARLGDEVITSALVNQYVPQIKPARARLYTTWFEERGVPAAPHSFGLPDVSGALPAGPASFPLYPASNPLALSVPDPIPRTIRVARRARPEESCRNNDIIAIEEMDIDEYVKGVLPPEIGVFRSLNGSSEVYKAFAIAAKSYGLYFMLYYDASNRRTVSSPRPPHGHTWFHIDDTACNQRYSDDRLSITTMASDAVANKIMVKRGDPNELDKFEYAASCGRHGTLPEYGQVSSLVPDAAPTSPCIGSWCGHNTCAGHEDNPNLSGSDRCLVRGICQWGSASWGVSGKDYIWLLNHYQPNLEIRDLAVSGPAAVVLQGYTHVDPSEPAVSAVAGIEVTLSDGQSKTSGSDGFFRFESVSLDLGTVTLTARGAGFEVSTRSKMLIEGTTNWASILMVAQTDSETMDEEGGDEEDMSSGSMRDMGGMDPEDMDSPLPLDDIGRDASEAPIEDEEDTFADMRIEEEEKEGTAPLGPLFTTSSGVRGDGCTAAPTHRSPLPEGLVFLALLVPWGATRRRGRI